MNELIFRDIKLSYDTVQALFSIEQDSKKNIYLAKFEVRNYKRFSLKKALKRDQIHVKELIIAFHEKGLKFIPIILVKLKPHFIEKLHEESMEPEDIDLEFDKQEDGKEKKKKGSYWI